MPAPIDCEPSSLLEVYMDLDLFSDDARRNPYPVYERIRAVSLVLKEPATGIWMVFDYETVKRILTDSETFSSKYGPPGWMIFLDPPRHTKLRALVAKAFTPRSVANLEPRITELVRGLLDGVLERGEMDLAADFAVPLPMMVIAEMLGIPTSDRGQFKKWVDIMVAMSHAVLGTPEGGKINRDILEATKEMAAYLARLLEARRRDPTDDLLTRLLAAEVDGERLGDQEILGFFQLLQATTYLLPRSPAMGWRLRRRILTRRERALSALPPRPSERQCAVISEVEGLR
jgi:cytochrome P450